MLDRGDRGGNLDVGKGKLPNQKLCMDVEPESEVRKTSYYVTSVGIVYTRTTF